MTNNSTRNSAARRNTGRDRGRSGGSLDGPVWLWGTHAVLAALQNPSRSIISRLATENAARRNSLDASFEIATAKAIDAALPAGAVHQGIAIQAHPLEPAPLERVIDAGAARIAVLDQIADPHNLGAILRSAAAFGVDALVLQTRHAPAITGIVAKSAAGAAETVNECRVVNIARALDALRDAGYHCVGLAGEGTERIETAINGAPKLAIVLGAEGSGLRPAVAKACDTLAKIDISPAMESLNVSNAAAITFYAAQRAGFP